ILVLQMDTSQLDELRRWGQQLTRDDSSPDQRAAGRAILLLVDEVERLSTEEPAPPEDEPPPPREEDGPAPPPRSPPKPKSWFSGLRKLVIAGVVVGALVFATLALGARFTRPSLDAQGPAANAGIGPALLPSLKFSVGADPSVLNRVHWRLDGKDVT